MKPSLWTVYVRRDYAAMLACDLDRLHVWPMLWQLGHCLDAVEHLATGAHHAPVGQYLADAPVSTIYVSTVSREVLR